jgi:membrane fusion protein (multidrug efflux system)
VRAYLIVIVILLAIFGSIGGYLYNKFSAFANMDFTPPPVTIAASVARTDSWEQYLDAVGTVKAVRGIDLSSETSGEITSINFDSGDKVQEGQLLLVLNDHVEQASRRNQMASLDLAQILFDRDSKLIAKKSIPETQFDRSKADLASARAQLAETEARLRNKRIHAPFSGTVGIRQVNRGDYISPGTVIATLQALDELEVDFTIPGQEAPLLRTGLAVEVLVDAWPERVFEATLYAIDSRVDAGTRNILARAKLAPGSELLPGMFARLRVNLDSQQQLVTVPETALTYSLHGNTVFVIKRAPEGDGEIAESVIVEVGQVRDGRVAILSGIQPGDRVVTAGQNKLYRDARVAVDTAVQM